MEQDPSLRCRALPSFFKKWNCSLCSVTAWLRSLDLVTLAPLRTFLL